MAQPASDGLNHQEALATGASTAWVLRINRSWSTAMRYGMNPHQAARIMTTDRPLTVRNGEPSMINYLDALNAWQLVREAREAVHAPVATSFKHLSPAGVATAGAMDAFLQNTWGVPASADGTLLSAYVRARDSDPKSSFGDAIAVSEPVDDELADFLAGVVSDLIVAPGFESGVVAKLARKKRGTYLVFEADPVYAPPAWESREVFGMRFEQERDQACIDAGLFREHHGLSAGAIHDMLLALVTLRYTQSNSVCLVKNGATLGIGAGQQSRVDCVRLAAAKARVWWLRRHSNVVQLQPAHAMKRGDLLNWQMRFAEEAMTHLQQLEFASMFDTSAMENFNGKAWRDDWMQRLSDVTLASDGFLPFRDNVDYAAEVGVKVIVEPGGSARSEEVRDAARALGIRHIETGLRLFHH